MKRYPAQTGGIRRHHLILGIVICLGLFIPLSGTAQNLLIQNQTIINDKNHNRYLSSNLSSGDIIQIDSNGRQSYFARNTRMDMTMSISGNVVYGGSYADQRLRGYDLETGAQVLNIVVPNTTQLLHTAADSSGNIFITEPKWDGQSHGQLIQFQISDQTFTTRLSTLPSDVVSVVFDQKNNRLVTVTKSGRILGIDLTTYTVTTLATIGFDECYGLTKDKYGAFYVSEPYWIYRYDPLFAAPPEMVYRSNCYVNGVFHGGIMFTDYDVRRNVIILPLQNCSTWDTCSIVKMDGPYLGQKFPSSVAKVFAQGILPSSSVFGLTFSPDGFECFYGNYPYLMTTKLQDGEWTLPAIAPFSGSYGDVEPHITPDGQKLFFSSDRPPSPSASDLRLWYLDRAETNWSGPNIVESPLDQTPILYPSVAANGNLYFTTNNSGSEPNWISVSRFVDGVYQTPERLSDSVNFKLNTAHPFIAPDESYLLYDAPTTYCTYCRDIYISFRKPDSSWTKAFNVGVQINSQQGNELCPFVSRDGQFFFFSRGGTEYWVSTHELLDTIPYPPAGFSAYSDFRTPTSVQLRWIDPTRCPNGRPVSNLKLRLYRNSVLIAEIEGGVQTYVDSGLTNHQYYSYTIRAVVVDDSSTAMTASACAGGDAIALPPTDFIVRDTAAGIFLQWKNPSRQLDGTPLNDLAAVLIYRDGVLADSIGQTSADTNQIRTYLDPVTGYHTYMLCVRDNETPYHYSSWSDSLLGYGGEIHTSTFENSEDGANAVFCNGDWDTTNHIAYSRLFSLTDSPEGSYAAGSNTYILLPPVAVDSGAVLAYYDIAIVKPPDSVYVEISTNQRETFSIVKRYNWSIEPKWQDGAAGAGDWRLQVIDLSEYIGDTVTIRFRLVSLGTGARADGWYIDDITIGSGLIPPPYQFSHRSGWNILSVPLLCIDTRKDSVFPLSVSGALYYDPDSGRYLTKNTMESGKAYWLKFPSEGETLKRGDGIERDTFEVRRGWNMIGSLSKPVPVRSIGSDPPGLIVSEFFRYACRYLASDTLQPCKGYWVHVSEAGKLLLSADTGYTLGHGIAIRPGNEMPPSPPGNRENGESDLPLQYGLFPNYPNPFNPQTVVRYDVPQLSLVRIEVYNILGSLVRTLLHEVVQPGTYTVGWDGSDMNGTEVPSGMYFIRLLSGEFMQSQKAILIK